MHFACSVTVLGKLLRHGLIYTRQGMVGVTGPFLQRMIEKWRPPIALPEVRGL